MDQPPRTGIETAHAQFPGLSIETDLEPVTEHPTGRSFEDAAREKEAPPAGSPERQAGIERVETEMDRSIRESETVQAHEQEASKIAALLRQATTLAEIAASKGREPYHRRMAIVRTKTQEALLFALFGDRV